jgi:hypothetical protein
MLDEIISLTSVTATHRWKDHLDYCWGEGGKVADAANNILSAMVARSPALARSICDKFSYQYQSWSGGSLFPHANRQTIDIIKHAGADSLYIQYRLMSMSTDITDWQQSLDEGVDVACLNWALMYALKKTLSTEHLKFLVSNGADVNYRLYSLYRNWGILDSPLRQAALVGNTHGVCFLLDHGVDVLLATPNLSPASNNASADTGTKSAFEATPRTRYSYSLSETARDRGHQRLAEKLEGIEQEEMTKRGVIRLPPAGELFFHCAEELSLTAHS